MTRWLRPRVMACRVSRVASVLLVAVGAGARAGESAQAAIGCVAEARIGCGCALRLRDRDCPDRPPATGPQLFTGLDSEAPLYLVLDGRERVLHHRSHGGGAIKGDPPGAFLDRYRGDGLDVEIRYRPGQDTCTKPPDEGCEYRDLAVEVEVRRPGLPALLFDGTATCGC